MLYSSFASSTGFGKQDAILSRVRLSRGDPLVMTVMVRHIAEENGARNCSQGVVEYYIVERRLERISAEEGRSCDEVSWRSSKGVASTVQLGLCSYGILYTSCNGDSPKWEQGFFLFSGKKTALRISPFFRFSSTIFRSSKSIESDISLFRNTNFNYAPFTYI